MNFIVDRLHWNRGSIGDDEVVMYSEWTHQFDICGFVANQLGVPTVRLIGLESPEDLLNMYPDYRDAVGLLATRTLPLDVFEEPVRTPFADLIIELNDDPSLTEDEREWELMKAFMRVNHQVTFIN